VPCRGVSFFRERGWIASTRYRRGIVVIELEELASYDESL